MLPVTTEDIRLFLHVLAATIWVGGQLTLAALVPVVRRAGADVPRSVARQFNRIAWPAFAVLVATGVWNVFADHNELRHDSHFRITLWVKLALVVLSGLSAYLHTRAKTKAGLALWGAGTGVFALAASFFGLVLAHG